MIDGSLLPLTVRGNIHLTVLMLAEKLGATVVQERTAGLGAESVADVATAVAARL